MRNKKSVEGFSIWVEPDGKELTYNEPFRHSEMIEDYYGVQTWSAHQWAFSHGFLRISVTKEEIAFQWAGELTHTQRRIALILAEDIPFAMVASADDGYDPENDGKYSYVPEGLHRKRLLSKALQEIF